MAGLAGTSGLDIFSERRKEGSSEMQIPFLLLTPLPHSQQIPDNKTAQYSFHLKNCELRKITSLTPRSHTQTHTHTRAKEKLACVPKPHTSILGEKLSDNKMYHRTASSLIKSSFTGIIMSVYVS